MREKVIIYTDGACSGNPGPGGWGAILMYKGAKKEISGGMKETTNNIMEMTAVIEALKCLKVECDVELYSDSAYTVNAFNQGWIYNWMKNGWRTYWSNKDVHELGQYQYDYEHLISKFNLKDKIKRSKLNCFSNNIIYPTLF